VRRPPACARPIPGVLLAAAFALFAVFAAVEAAAQPAPVARPNIVVVLADDLGWGDLGCYGHPRFKTPHLDRLAAGGARLTSFYVPVPYCAPVRAALLTGRYPLRNGLIRNPFPGADPQVKQADHIGLDTDETTLAEVLRQAGYRTACIGKWHLGHRPQFRPLRRGFDEFYGILYSNDMHPVELFDGEEMVEYPVVQATLGRRLTERALRFIERSRNWPFFLYFPLVQPHKPLFASEEFYEQSGAGLYGDTVAELDWSVGQLAAKLADLGLERNTLFVFTSDNGPWYGGSTGGLRGMKGQHWEGGIRVPCIARWPGRIPAGTASGKPAIIMDLFATALEAAKLPAPPGPRLDGRDILPLLGGEKSPHEVLFSSKGEEVATVRSGKWKLHLLAPSPPNEKVWRPEEKWVDPRGPDGVRILAPFEQAHPSQFPGITPGRPFTLPALFDLEADREEQHDVAAAHPEIVERLKALAERHAAELRADPTAGRRR
jgi:N-acetylgalactosamine-6-sulfatase